MILFIDTHDSLITIGIKTDNELLTKTKESEYSHSKYVMPMIKELFDESNLDVHDLKEIVVVNGPGSFTGIRIGLTIAKTMAYSLDISIKSISSLTAYLVSNDSNSDKMCLIEDNKGYYVSVFDKDNNSIIPECYSEEVNYNYPVIENKLDIEKILNYVSKLSNDDYYHIKANYVKKIEVEK